MAQSLEAAISQAVEAGSEFDRQAARLTQASTDAAAQAQTLSESELDARRDLFLKTARFIIEDLNSISIDLSRVLYNEVPEADWKRYAKGDRGVFTRNLLRGRHAAMVRRVTDKIKEDEEIRGYVLRYVDQYDRLLEDCLQCDPENLLHSTFLTADVGKLYILLCRALGRDE